MFTVMPVFSLIFQLLDCVNIDGKSYLYLQGDFQHTCNGLIRAALVMYLIFYIISFLVVLVLGSYLLRKCLIKPATFVACLLASPIPVPVPLIYIIWKFTVYKLHHDHFRRGLRQREAQIAWHILDNIVGPFRSDQNLEGEECVCKNGFCSFWRFYKCKKCKAMFFPMFWVLVFKLKQLVLVILSNYVHYQVGSFIGVICCLMLSAIIQAILKPFKNSKLNTISIVFLVILSFLSIVSMFWAYAVFVDLTGIPYYDDIADAFVGVQIIVDTSMLVILILGILRLVWVLVRGFVKCRISYCKCTEDQQISQLQQPLLQDG